MIETVRYEVEICANNNGSLYFQPAGRILRGRWQQFAAMRYDVGRSIRTMANLVGDDIPGIRVFADLATGVVGYFDPLTDPKNAKMAEAINRYMMSVPGNNKRGVSFTDPYKLRTKDVNVLKDWLFWMRTCLDAGYAKDIPGVPSPPSLDLIKQMPGQRKLYGEPLQDPISVEAHERYKYSVPETDTSVLVSPKAPAKS